MRILVVEDDVQLKEGLKELLVCNGYEVDMASDILEAERMRRNRQVDREKYQLYLVDVMLASDSGFELCEKIRQTEHTPVIFLTALDDEDSVIKGLDIGADDYITKPFRSKELLARIAANIRRSEIENQTELRGRYLKSGDIAYSVLDGRVFLRGKEIILRKIEAELLQVFLESNGRLLKREYIFNVMWDQAGEFVEDNTLSVQISRLRKQLGRYGNEEYITTIRGIGYRWNQKVIREGREDK